MWGKEEASRVSRNTGNASQRPLGAEHGFWLIASKKSRSSVLQPQEREACHQSNGT